MQLFELKISRNCGHVDENDVTTLQHLYISVHIICSTTGYAGMLWIIASLLLSFLNSNIMCLFNSKAMDNYSDSDMNCGQDECMRYCMVRRNLNEFL